MLFVYKAPMYEMYLRGTATAKKDLEGIMQLMDSRKSVIFHDKNTALSVFRSLIKDHGYAVTNLTFS